MTRHYRDFGMRAQHALGRRLYPVKARVMDGIADRALRQKIDDLRGSSFYRNLPRQRILAVGVQSPRRPGSLDAIFARMRDSRHAVVTEKKDIDGLGKLDNTNILMGRHDLSGFDWLWMVDDDVELPNRFTDDFVATCALAGLKIAMPAHRALSYSSFPITRRQPGALARTTNFVEVGPIAAFHRDTFDTLLPLPSLRYGWGLDLTWGVVAERMGWPIGVVDATPLRHSSPIGTGYDVQAAVDEAEAYMAGYGIVTGEHVIREYDRIDGLPN